MESSRESYQEEKRMDKMDRVVVHSLAVSYEKDLKKSNSEEEVEWDKGHVDKGKGMGRRVS